MCIEALGNIFPLKIQYSNMGTRVFYSSMSYHRGNSVNGMRVSLVNRWKYSLVLSTDSWGE